MKRSFEDDSRTTKDKTQRAMTTGSSDIVKGNEIIRGVFLAEYKQIPAVLKTIETQDLPFYLLFEKTRYLPVIFDTDFKNIRAPVICMERLQPFVFDAERVPEYFGALKELVCLSENPEMVGGAKPARMDITPSNLMMRADGTPVFIDQWGQMRTPFYFRGDMENKPHSGELRSLALTLLSYEHAAVLRSWMHSLFDSIFSLEPDVNRWQLILGIPPIAFNHARGQKNENKAEIAVVEMIFFFHRRAQKLADYAREKGKTLEQCFGHRGCTPEERKDDDDFFNKSKERTYEASVSLFMESLFERIGKPVGEDPVMKCLATHGVSIAD